MSWSETFHSLNFFSVKILLQMRCIFCRCFYISIICKQLFLIELLICSDLQPSHICHLLNVCVVITFWIKMFFWNEVSCFIFVKLHCMLIHLSMINNCLPGLWVYFMTTRLIVDKSRGCFRNCFKKTVFAKHWVP